MRPMPAAFAHLHDPGLLLRLMTSDEDMARDMAGFVDDVEPVEPAKRRKHRPSLAKAIRQAVKAGMKVSGATVGPDGSVVLTFSDGSTTTSNNPWDRVLRNAAN
jgi:hypothetical protein